jgi:hypothetical protein
MPKEKIALISYPRLNQGLIHKMVVSLITQKKSLASPQEMTRVNLLAKVRLMMKRIALIWNYVK